MSDIDQKFTPRHIWFRDRVEKCILEINNLCRVEDWYLFRKQARDLAVEILYAVNEWDKYYVNEKIEKEN